MANKEIRPGVRFGRLTVIEAFLRAPLTDAERKWRKRQGRLVARCICDCGGSRTVEHDKLRSGNTSSCGCARREAAAKATAASLVGRSGVKKHPHYRRWCSMISRCTYPRSASYKSYGGRGIKVFEGWANDPWAFFAWLESELGPLPKGHSLDRIDVNGNYEPGNLRWASWSEQSRNQRHPGPAKARSASNYLGVYQNRRRWSAQTQVNGQRYYLGSFDTPEDAAKAFDEKVRQLKGASAFVNFPQPGDRQWDADASQSNPRIEKRLDELEQER